MKTAAALATAKAAIEANLVGTKEEALVALMQLSPKYTKMAFEKWFPVLADLALQVASDACVKKALNIIAESFNAPRITTEESVDLILEDFRKAVKLFLNTAGRRLGSTELISEVQEALLRIKVKRGKRPTQQQVADILGIEARTLRARQSKYGIKTWGEMLQVCGWHEEIIPR